jgi:hypothetical protein
MISGRSDERYFHDHWRYKMIIGRPRSTRQVQAIQLIKAQRAAPEQDRQGRRRHFTIRAIPYQDPQQEAERLKVVHEARVKIVPRV